MKEQRCQGDLPTPPPPRGTSCLIKAFPTGLPSPRIEVDPDKGGHCRANALYTALPQPLRLLGGFDPV
jgi:hypothetical protein